MQHTFRAGAVVLMAAAALTFAGTAASATSHDAAKTTTTSSAAHSHKSKASKSIGTKKATSPYIFAQALTGSKHTKTFTAKSAWQLGYYYTCPKKKGSFTLYLRPKHGHSIKVTSQPPSTGGGGSRTYRAGQFSLSANTTCKWDVTVIKKS